MTRVYVIANSDGLVLSKQGEWLDLNKLKHAVYSTDYDVMLNELIERNQKHIEERLKVCPCDTDEKQRPKSIIQLRESTTC
jgi:hypothetical protein